MKRDFSLFTGLLKTARVPGDDGDDLVLTGIASSTIKDRHGDTMTESALQSMLRSADGMTIYLNHEYKVPEDVAGTVRKSWIDRSGDLHDLHFEISINQENPRAVQAFNAIDKGTKLGLSIGAMIPEGGARREKKSGAYVINEVELLETSIVSIPANPRSWVDYARKSLLTKSDVPEVEDEEPVLKDGEDDVTTSPVTVTHDNLDISRSAGTHPHAHSHDHEHTHGYGESETVHAHEHAHVHSHEHDADHEHEDDQNDWQHNHDHEGAYNDEGHAHGDGKDEASKDVEPDVEKAKVTVWPSGKVSVDTTPAQDAAPQADPEPAADPDALADALGEMARSIDPDVEKTLGPTFMATLQTSQRIALALIAEVEKATTRAVKAEQERDEVVRAAETLTKTTEAFIARVAAYPRGRRAIAREAPVAVKALEGVRESGIYSDEFMSILAKENHA